MKARSLRLVARSPSVPTDAEALAEVARGDIGALGDVYDRHAGALLTFASRVGDPSDAEDLVQAVFIRASKAAPTYDGRAESARAWLLGIAARLLQERRRSLLRFSRALFGLHALLPSSRTASGDHVLDLEKGLHRMSQAKRVVLILAELEGFTCGEIATALSIPVGTVWTRLHHARKELRRYFEEEP